MKPLANLLPRTPFWFLVGHFVERLFAGEEEQSSESFSPGIGAVLAMAASPGALASLILLDKYSPLLHWLRGIRHFDFYRASAQDEYFFIVLSMTVTGLVTVQRWNRLFPDRRDFANLAILPIPIRNIFLAHFVALFSLAAMFTIDINLVSFLLFPGVVTMSDVRFAVFFHVAISHATAVLSASFFIFFGVFALVGVLMLLTPERWFRTASIAARILLTIALVSQLLSNLLFEPAQTRWLPSLWFLGLYERIIGLGRLAAAQFAQTALLALAASILVSLVAYVLCYRRHFLRLAESLDLVGSAHKHFRFRIPDFLSKTLFRSSFEHASNSFALKVLFRSERHLMLLGAYLGMGLLVTAQTAMDGIARSNSSAIPNPDLLAVPLMIAFFLITGLRFAFDMPAALNANWIFRISVSNPAPPPSAIARRLMLQLVVPSEMLFLVPLTERYGWRIVCLHAAAVLAVSALMIDLLYLKFRKIPFTCSKETEIRQLLVRILGSLFALTIGVPILASIEHWMLLRPGRLVSGAVLIGAAWLYLQRYRRALPIEEKTLLFEERPAASFELLKLV